MVRWMDGLSCCEIEGVTFSCQLVDLENDGGLEVVRY